MNKVFNSREEFVQDAARPWKQKYYELELEATAALGAGNRDEERLLRKKAAIIKKHITRLEALV
jgi:hypothetical protein